ncbi:MAG: lasso RiPP family leader peptide-containing protein [Thermoanaerobaculia bacterium]
MEGQRADLQPENPKARAIRKPYSPPQLQEWGSIQELTQGPTFTHTDFPKGGSRPT